ncbi:AraC family transcriptional regulator [Acinetobacter sp. IK40]|jgi:AraC-like DNA-binding protein|uniref:AraC family transcriptional regulator n=1 Tax=Acinetobacter sp. IK40 TaxID=2928897 RepID=UPI002D1E6A52|nr:AraC family transcriptional regulator ligand-binding domain-containing protein [Acinetobacter sp. IK40]MEB3792511.1 AraC family transcriptional regulator [Acinetobacter sp. IK40]
MTETPSIPSVLLELIAKYLQQRNMSNSQLDELSQQYAHQQRMPLSKWWELLEEIYQQHPTPVLGHYIGELAEPHHIHILGYLALSNPNLNSFLNCFKNFQPILQNSAAFSILQKEDSFCMCWTPVVHKNSQLSNEVLISGVISTIRKILHRPDIQPLKIEFSAVAPADCTPYQQVYGCPVSFDSEVLRLWLPLEILHLPIPSSDPHLKKLLDQQAEALLKSIPNPDTFLKDLQLLIVNMLKSGEPSAEHIARQMKLSLRSFYRKLGSYNLQYSDLVKSIRLELAKTYLIKSELSLTEIALLLGYAEQSAFSRAFKQWEKVSPSEYRKNHLP